MCQVGGEWVTLKNLQFLNNQLLADKLERGVREARFSLPMIGHRPREVILQRNMERGSHFWFDRW